MRDTLATLQVFGERRGDHNRLGFGSPPPSIAGYQLPFELRARD
jgi:hypothetical protein